MSYNEHRPNAFIPSAQELIASVSFSLLILGAFNVTRIIDYHRNNELAVQADTRFFKFDFIDRLDPRLIPTIETFAIWAMIGLGFYLLVWFIISMLGEAKDEAGAVHGFVFPRKKDRQRYEIDIMRRTGIRMFGIAGFILWLGLLFTKVLPACALYFYLACTHEPAWDVAGKAVISVISFGLYLFLAAPILRMMVLKPRVFSEW